MRNKTLSINLEHAFKRLASDVGLDKFTRRYCILRLRAEGVPFLTVTLPKLSKAVLRSLELGYFERPTDFAWKGGSLRYFRSLLNQIFDPRTGYVRDNVDAVALWRLRQLCEYFYKLALEYSTEDLSVAERTFVSEENEMRATDVNYPWVMQLRRDLETFFPKVATAKTHEVFQSCRPRPPKGTFSGRGKDWYLRRYYDFSPSPKYKPYAGYFKPYPSCSAVDVEFDETPLAESEVLFVPKDSRGPRVIVREEYKRSLAHLAFHDWLTTELEEATRYRINFRDQRVNRELAQLASKTKEYCTIDLKNASDRVDHRIIRGLVRFCPALRFFIADRARYATLPSGEVVELCKLAGMGSGLTFPLMSLLIYLSICRNVSIHARKPYREVMKHVYVYGDDIIVPTAWYDYALEALQLVGLKVNTEKSFKNSHFRESCGGDFYNGQDVAPVRARLSGSKLTLRRLTLQLKGPLAILGLERHCRELVRGAMLGLANLYYNSIETAVGGLPHVSGDSPVLGRYEILPPKYEQEPNGNYKTVRVLVPMPKLVKGPVCPYVYLGTLFRSRGQDFDPLGYLDTQAYRTYGDVAVPREVVLTRVNVSAFRLIG